MSFNFITRYEYEPAFASQLSRDTGCVDTGVIAQEVAQILPEAVRPAGDLILDNGTAVNNFLVVNKVSRSSDNYNHKSYHLFCNVAIVENTHKNIL